MWDAAKAITAGKFIALIAYVRNENDLKAVIQKSAIRNLEREN